MSDTRNDIIANTMIINIFWHFNSYSTVTHLKASFLGLLLLNDKYTGHITEKESFKRKTLK